jgi:DNA-binding protein YbaB
MDMFKNLQDLQSKMGEAQEKLKTLRADGSSGGELVKVTVDGTMEALSVHIDPIAVDPGTSRCLKSW